MERRCAFKGFWSRVLFISVFLLLTAQFASAQCPFLQVTSVSTASVQKGVDASFPIIVKNSGNDIQNVLVSAINPDPKNIDASLDPSSSYIYSGQEQTFHLFVRTDSSTPGNYTFSAEVSSDNIVSVCTEPLSFSLEIKPSNLTFTTTSNFSASMSPVTLPVKFPGDLVNFAISAVNDFPEGVIVSIDAVSSPFPKSTFFDESQFFIDSKKSKNVNARVRIPPGTPAGTYYLLFRLKVNTGCCVQEYLLPEVPVYVAGKELQVSSLQEPLKCIDAKYGKQSFMEIGLRNDADITGPFKLELDGSEETLSAVQLPFDLFELKQGERQYFNLTIQPDSSLSQGTHQFTLYMGYLGINSFALPLCYTVSGEKKIEIEKRTDASVKRCTAGSFNFTVRNIGTLSDSYAVELSRSLTNASVKVSPASFSLAPGEDKEISFIIGTTCSTPLGKQTVPARIRSSNVSVSENFDVTIVSSNLSSQSLLSIKAPKISIVKGEDTEISINVTNKMNSNAEKTAISIEGLPPSWFDILDSQKTIRPNATAPFRVLFTPKSEGKFSINVSAVSGFESVVQSADMRAKAQERLLDYSFEVKPIETDGAVKEVIVTVTVTNKGNSRLTGISAGTPATGMFIVPLNFIDEIAPGETKQMDVSVRPLASATSEQSIPIKLQSAEGASKSIDVTIPAMSKPVSSSSQAEFPWKIAVAIVLLVLIFALLTKEKPPGSTTAFEI